MFHEIIKNRRIELNISVEEFSKKIGISPESTRDLEIYSDEYLTGVSLKQIIEMCNFLSIALENAGVLSTNSHVGLANTFSKIVKKKIENSGLSVEDVEETAGWEFWNDIEDNEKLINMPIIFFKDVGNALNIEWEKLIIAVINSQ